MQSLPSHLIDEYRLSLKVEKASALFDLSQFLGGSIPIFSYSRSKFLPACTCQIKIPGLNKQEFTARGLTQDKAFELAVQLTGNYILKHLQANQVE